MSVPVKRLATWLEGDFVVVRRVNDALGRLFAPQVARHAGALPAAVSPCSILLSMGVCVR